MATYADIHYISDNPHALQTLDIFIPQDQGLVKNVVVVIVHGGAWRSGSRAEYTHLSSRISRELRYPVVQLDYRLSPDVAHPAHLNDVRDALRFILDPKNSEKYGYAPITSSQSPQLFLIGHSCGATMISQIAFGFPDIDKHAIGYMGVQGIYDIQDMVEEYPQYMSFIEPAFGTDSRTYEAVSPTALARNSTVKHMPPKPFFLVHSKQDELLTTRQTLLMKDSLEPLLGWKVEYNDVLGGLHFKVIPTEEFFQYLIQSLACLEL